MVSHRELEEETPACDDSVLGAIGSGTVSCAALDV
jgi:hypothetical protein